MAFIGLGGKAASFIPLGAKLHQTQTSEFQLLAKTKGNPKGGRTSKRPKLPLLVVFDLDGCLWRPELFEILTSPLDSQGSPFSRNSKDEVPGTTLRSAGGVHTVELLGDTRMILHELFYNPKWYPTLVGISSRTDPPDWAEEFLSLFLIYNNDGSDRPPVSMKDIFTPELCILDKNMDKATQFEVLLRRANGLLPNKIKLQYKDIMFFDNEAGNCKQVAKLGVTAVYTPKGLTFQSFENGLTNFPNSRGVLGPKLPY